ncbi:protein-L-isoaspartate O-methyltransferase [Magnetospirillum sp. UT-4]|uniref:protein-L-isoaspartate O-methyltransferase family protein n=1 Tax=Magnetospirillum sp. UT-4 TaxID=2681467 RepID=UPI00137C9157|nr:protein-L-isoaspartate O-methyltransferase [Magnetospirillum sp. UT-4]CAA7618074.1 Protein-L-isoaspartate(D-aspartate) O-methyltransferase [Magnetospirillum sp. UT-4]
MDYARARANMVESQIRTNRILDPGLVRALSEIPREHFLPKAMRSFAYLDEDLELGGGRFLIEPLVLARLVAAVEIAPTDVVLCIGDATGYVTAVTARLAQTVVSLECDGEWATRAGNALGELKVDNAAVVQGPLDQGYPAQAPYQVILFAGGIGEVSPNLCRQLAEGGRLGAVVSHREGVGKGTVVTRVGDTFGRTVVFDGATPLLPGFRPKPGFIF